MSINKEVYARALSNWIDARDLRVRQEEEIARLKKVARQAEENLVQLMRKESETWRVVQEQSSAVAIKEPRR